MRGLQGCSRGQASGQHWHFWEGADEEVVLQLSPLQSFAPGRPRHTGPAGSVAFVPPAADSTLPTVSAIIQSNPVSGMQKSTQGNISRGHRAPFDHIPWLVTSSFWLHNRQKGKGSDSQRTQWTQGGLAESKSAGTEALFRKQIQPNPCTAAGDTEKPTHCI